MMVKEELHHIILLKVTIREVLVYYSTCNTFLEKKMLSFWEKNDLAPSEIPQDSWSATVVMFGKYPFSSFYLGGHYKLFHTQQNLHDKKNYTAHIQNARHGRFIMDIFFTFTEPHSLLDIILMSAFIKYRIW